MRIIDRYLTGQFLWALCYCACFLGVLFIVIDLFNNLNEFLRHGVTVGIVASYYFYLLPSLLAETAPIACLIALLYTLGNLNKNHEIIALKASGLSAYRILFPYLFVGLVASMGLFTLSQHWVPKSKISSKAIMEGLILKGKKNLNERSISNLTYYGQNHRMIFAREFETQAQTLHDVVIFEDNPSSPTQIKYTAKKAIYDNGQWTLHDALKQNLNRRGDIINEPQFEAKMNIEMSEKPENFLSEASQVEFMSSKELKNYIGNLKGTSQKLVQRLWVDYYYRMAFAFSALIVMLIGAPLSTRNIRQSAMAGMGTALALVVIYYVLESISVALGKGGYLPPLAAAWTANLILGLYGIYLIRKSA